jgi:arylsulfatase A-like enzyme
MKYSNIIFLSFFLALSFIFCSYRVKAVGNLKSLDKPNILIIITDDLGWNDIGYNGSSIKTPNIDRLAESGIRLDQHYVMPTCTPTRVSLMTGKYPSRYGITGPDYGEVIDMGDPTFASILSENGYYTSISGKWHMGSPPYTPLKYGFQSSYGYFDGQIDPFTHEYKMETRLTSRKSWHRNDEYLEEEGHATDLITDEAVRIIEEGTGKPFFLYVAYSVPHYPLDEPGKWVSVYEDVNMYQSRKWFAASVTHMDACIGKIIDALETTGKRKNTLILFTSDNGGQKSWYSSTEYRGKYVDKPHDVLGNNFPLRGWKGDLYEGGIRVPAFVNWPGKLKAGASDIPVHISDWLPTLCGLAGCENSDRLNIDGKNIWPFLTGQKSFKSTHPFYWKVSQYYAVRDGDWKLLLNRETNQPELYNLTNDFRETRDLSAENPETVEHMMKLLEEFKKDDKEK